MSIRLTELELACPSDGLNLFRVEQFLYDITSKTTKVTNLGPVCQRCNRSRYMGLIRIAEKIEVLKPPPSQKLKK